MAVNTKIPPHHRKLDLGSGNGQAPIQVPYSYDPITPTEYGVVSKDVVNLAHFGQEILVCSIIGVGVGGLLGYASQIPFSNTSPQVQGYLTPMDGVICWADGISDSAGGGLLEIYTQHVLVKSVQIFGGISEVNVAFQKGDVLNFGISGTTADNPVVTIGIRWILGSQL